MTVKAIFFLIDWKRALFFLFLPLFLFLLSCWVVGAIRTTRYDVTYICLEHIESDRAREIANLYDRDERLPLKALPSFDWSTYSRNQCR